MTPLILLPFNRKYQAILNRHYRCLHPYSVADHAVGAKAVTKTQRRKAQRAQRSTAQQAQQGQVSRPPDQQPTKDRLGLKKMCAPLLYLSAKHATHQIQSLVPSQPHIFSGEVHVQASRVGRVGLSSKKGLNDASHTPAI